MAGDADQKQVEPGEDAPDSTKAFSPCKRRRPDGRQSTFNLHCWTSVLRTQIQMQFRQVSAAVLLPKLAGLPR